MTEYFESYRSELTFAMVVIIVVIILYLATNLILKWVLKHESYRFPEAPIKPLKILKRTLNVLWVILGIIALSYLFVGSDKEETLNYYFKLTGYLGGVSVVTIVSSTLSNLWFRHKIQERIALDYDPTSFKFLRSVVVFTICFVGILFGLMAFPSLRGVAQTALGGAGVLALIAGVASQEALANLVGGVFIISFKPFRIGDVIKLSDSMLGTVTDITLRHTIIRNNENKMIVVPNAVMNKEKLINYDLGELKICELIEMGITYDSDIDLAKKILAEECANHPLILDNRSKKDITDGAPMVRTALIRFNDSSITIRAWAWARSYNEAFSLKCDVYESVKKRYDEEGVGLAFPTRTVYIANDKKVLDDDVDNS